MADKKVIGSQIKIEGDKQYKDALKDIQKQASLLKSEMKLVTASFSDNENGIDSLKSKQEVLQKQIENQTNKVNLLKESLENAKREYGENSDQVTNWQKKLNYAEADLANLNTELNKTENNMQQVTTESKQAGSAVDDFGNRSKGSSINTATLVAGVVALGYALKEVAGYAIGAVKESAQYADTILTTSKQTGIATDTLQELYYMQELTDVSLETLTGTMAKNIKSMNSAKDGTGDIADAYKRLGVNIVDSNGNLLDSETVYWNAIDALGEMTNETERDAIAMQLFGRSAQDLNPVIDIGSEGVKKYAEEARNMGAVLSDEVLGTLGDTDDAFQRMDQKLEIVKRQFGLAFAPAVTKGAEKLSTALEDMTDEIADAGTEIADNLVDALVFLIENIDKVQAVLKGLVGGFLTFKAINIGTSIVTSFMSLGTAITGATGAQLGLNTAMSANPFGAIATAISLVVAGLIALDDYATTTAENIDNVSENIIAMSDEVEASTNKINDNIEARENSLVAMENESVAVDDMIDRLFDLNEKQTLTNEEQATYKALIEELNGKIPDLNLTIDEQTGKITNQKDEVLKLTEAYYDQMIAQAAMTSLTKVLEDQYTAQTNLATQQQTLNDALDDYKKKSEEYYSVNDGLAKLFLGSFYDGKKVMEESKDAADEAIKAYEDAQGAVEGLSLQEKALIEYISSEGKITYEEALKRVQDNTTATNELSDANSDAVTSSAQASSDIANNYRNIPANIDIREAMSKKGKESTQGFTNAFESSWNEFINGTLGGLVNKLPLGIKKLLKIASPSKVMEELGEWTGEGFEVGVVDSMSQAQKSLSDMMAKSNSILSGYSSNMNITQNIRSTDYSAILGSISSVLAQQKTLNGTIVVNIAGKHLEYAISNVGLNSSMRYSEV